METTDVAAQESGHLGITPKLRAEIEAERLMRAAAISKIWCNGLTHKDWLFDGSPIRSERMIDRFNHLDWSKAWIDLGPSIAGNLGPYWHVPMDDGDTVHRLYPKILQSRWALLVLHACYESQKLTAHC